MNSFNVPLSNDPAMLWPAIPAPDFAVLFALSFQLEQSQWWPSDGLQDAQFRQLEVLLGHAVTTTDYYRERLGREKLGGQPAGWLTPGRWRELPILRRSDINQFGPLLVSNAVPPNHLPTRRVRTSGATGAPVEVAGTALTSLFFAASNLRYHQWHARSFAATVACIRKLTPALRELARTNQPAGWVPGYPSGPIYHLDIATTPSEQLNWLATVRPHYLLTYPSNLKALLEFASQESERAQICSNLHAVCTMSEPLDPELRAACATQWGAAVTDAYSAQELGMIALQCPTGPHYHVVSESVLVEVLDDQGRTCEPGQTGELVVTSLHNFATPLVRYALGDYAEVGPPCSCGRGLPVLRQILGRVRNMLVLPDNRGTIWPSFGSRGLTDIAPIRQHQFVQPSTSELKARLVVDRPLTENEEERLRIHIQSKIPSPFKIRFVYVDSIPRHPSGKFEDFVSEVTAQNR